MNKIIAIGLLASCTIAFSIAFAGDDANSAALVKALPQATISLAKAIETSEREGKPISAKFEMEDGALQLSVYTSKGDSFKEVIVDHKSGEIKESKTIADAGDLKSARAQSRALSKTVTSLAHAVDAAVGANKGSHAVSVMPALNEGHPVAKITLLSGAKLKTVTEKLD